MVKMAAAANRIVEISPKIDRTETKGKEENIDLEKLDESCKFHREREEICNSASEGGWWQCFTVNENRVRTTGSATQFRGVGVMKAIIRRESGQAGTDATA